MSTARRLLAAKAQSSQGRRTRPGTRVLQARPGTRSLLVPHPRALPTVEQGDQERGERVLGVVLERLKRIAEQDEHGVPRLAAKARVVEHKAADGRAVVHILQKGGSGHGTGGSR